MEFRDMKKINQMGSENSEFDETLLDLDNNPLKDIPESKMRLYAFVELLKTTYFDKKEKLDRHIKFNKKIAGEPVMIDYLGQMAGKTDVIRITYKDVFVSYVSLVDILGYAVYNERQSILEGKYIWEYEYGDLKDIYDAFKKRGIELVNDVYGKHDELYSSVSDSFVDIARRR